MKQAMHTFLLACLITMPALAVENEGIGGVIEANPEKLYVIDYISSYKDYVLRLFKDEKILQEKLDTLDYVPSLSESTFFKVVEGNGNTVLPITDIDARNVLYHLNKARGFFVKLAGTDYSSLNNKITVRVRVENGYNPFEQFSDKASKNQRYNNSRYIPKHYGDRWGNEMWFHKPKDSVSWPALVGAMVPIAAGAGPIAVLSLPFVAANAYDRGMDSAKIPSVIYHEAFHWASGADELFKTTAEPDPLYEDYANYFAAAIEGRGLIGHSLDFSTLNHTRNIQKIKIKVKGKKHNYNVALPSFFWNLRSRIDNDRLNQGIWNSIKHYGNCRYTCMPDAVYKGLVEANASPEELRFFNDQIPLISEALIQLDQMQN